MNDINQSLKISAEAVAKCWILSEYQISFCHLANTDILYDTTICSSLFLFAFLLSYILPETESFAAIQNARSLLHILCRINKKLKTSLQNMYYIVL